MTSTDLASELCRKRGQRGFVLKRGGSTAGMVTWSAREGVLVLVIEGETRHERHASDAINYLNRRGYALDGHSRGLLTGYVAAKLEA